MAGQGFLKVRTCEEARLVLRQMDRRKSAQFTQAEEDAWIHFRGYPFGTLGWHPECTECSQLGISAITGIELECQAACLLWAHRYSHDGHAIPGFRSIEGLVAEEHIRSGRCAHPVCAAIRNLDEQPHVNDYQHVHFFTVVLRAARRAGWPLQELFELQVRQVLSQLDIHPDGSFPFRIRLVIEAVRGLQRLITDEDL